MISGICISNELRSGVIHCIMELGLHHKKQSSGYFEPRNDLKFRSLGRHKGLDPGAAFPDHYVLVAGISTHFLNSPNLLLLTIPPSPGFDFKNLRGILRVNINFLKSRSWFHIYNLSYISVMVRGSLQPYFALLTTEKTKLSSCPYCNRSSY